MTARKRYDNPDLEVLDIQGHPDGITNPEHARQRDIAHELTQALEVDAVVLVTVKHGMVVTSTTLSHTVDEAAHAAVGGTLLRGLRTCAEQVDRALVRGANNGGRAPEERH